MPENGLLAVGESMQVTIDFQPTLNGESKDELVINYDTGLRYKLMIRNKFENFRRKNLC